ncbi:hypothetical protein DUI87_02451 [Hirundo rustica rustica]|uniref:Reverse transcriptase domain-containing protein n=1 Tax=Hirundo rustica rustica TaxID=333673 RepID=A0A3M0LCB1_HIRRU|nr:hypothetical protein DUI87_02451 [Hirundo rustica rustica]
MKREDMEETVLDIAKKLRAYADAVHGPTHARIAAVETRLQKLEDKIDENHKKLKEEIREDLLQISAVQIRSSSSQQNPSAVGLLKVEEQQVPIATSIVHRRQYRTTRDAVIPIHKMIHYRALNEVTPPLSAAVPDMLELQYELESKAAKWYATIDIANAFFSIPLAAECRPQFAFTWRGVQYT